MVQGRRKVEHIAMVQGRRKVELTLQMEMPLSGHLTQIIEQ
jgi:hypothetical protein